MIDGISFVPLLQGKPLANLNRPLYWHYPNNWGPTGPGIGATSTIRERDWKLIYYHADGRYELFDLKNDLGETKNLADLMPEVRSQLANRLGRYLADVHAQMPKTRDGKLVPYPGNVKPAAVESAP